MKTGQVDGVVAATATGLVARVLGLINNVVALPITLTVLGEVRFAAFVAITGLSQAIALSGLGVSKALAQQAAQVGSDDFDLRENTKIAFLICLAFSVIIAGGMSYAMLIWHESSDELSVNWDDFKATLVVFVIFVVLAGSFQVFADLQTGLLRMWVVNVCRAFGALATTILLVVVVPLIGSVWAAVLSVTLGYTIGLVLVYFSLPADLGNIRPFPSYHAVRLRAWRLIRGGVDFVFIQGFSILLLNLPPFLIVWSLGASASVDFGIHARALLLIWSLTAIVSNPTWPAVRRMMTAGSLTNAKVRIRNSAIQVGLMAAVAALLFAAAGDKVILLWVGRPIADYSLWLPWFPLAVIAVSGNQLVNNVLMGLDRARWVALINGVYCVSTLVIGTQAANVFGGPGFFAVTTLVGTAALFLNILQIRKTFRAKGPK